MHNKKDGGIEGNPTGI